jgi:hypothetical protein
MELIVANFGMGHYVSYALNLGVPIPSFYFNDPEGGLGQ